MRNYTITYGPEKHMTCTYKARNKDHAREKFYKRVDSLEDETGEDLEWMTECVIVTELDLNEV